MARQKVVKFISEGYSNETSQNNRKDLFFNMYKVLGTIERNDGRLEATVLSSLRSKEKRI